MLTLFLAIAGQISDVLSTWLVIRSGGVETNPLLGPDPDLFMVLLVKMIVVSLVFCLLKGAAKIRVLFFCSLIGFGAASWNMHIYLSDT